MMETTTSNIRAKPYSYNTGVIKTYYSINSDDCRSTFTRTTVMREFAKNVRCFSITYMHIYIYIKRT